MHPEMRLDRPYQALVSLGEIIMLIANVLELDLSAGRGVESGDGGSRVC